MNIEQIVELYQQRLAERQPRLDAFFAGKLPFLIVQRPFHGPVWTDCLDAAKIARNNLDAFAKSVALDASDDLPYLEPWYGVGVYANAFGCPYHWEPNESPGTNYRYLSLAELPSVEYPDWRRSPAMQVVLESIDRINDATGGRLPVIITDTQSPLDTATLIVDSTEFMIGCYEYPERAKDLLSKITELTIEFTRQQIKHIGPAAYSAPGHLQCSRVGGHGISISDDNLSFCSPDFNREFAFPYNHRLADAFGGVAIHSCGRWAHTMQILERGEGVFMIDCAAALSVDPAPNRASEIRDAMRGKKIVTKVRTGNITETMTLLDDLYAPDLQLIIEVSCDEVNAQDNYRRIQEKLSKLYQ